MNTDPYTYIAPVYNTLTSVALAPVRQRMGEVCLEFGLHTVADIGCGTGTLLASLQKQGIVGIGIDASPAMLQHSPLQIKERIVLADASSLPFAPQQFDCLIYSLILHETNTDPVSLLLQGFSVAPYALVLEWHSPERNLDYLCTFWAPFIERLAGAQHYSNYRTFIRHGGMNGLIHQTQARCIYEERALLGSLRLCLLHKAC